MNEKKTSKVSSIERSKGGLEARTVKGLFYMLSTSNSSFVINLISFIALSRILSPNDFGIYNMFFAFVSVVALFRDLGLKESTIQSKEISQLQLSSLFWSQLVLGIFLFGVIVISAPLIVKFYQVDNIEYYYVIYALAGNMIIQSVSLQHNALLVRNLEFKKVAAVTFFANFLSILIAFLLALKGVGYWALVMKLLVFDFLLSAGFIYFSKWCPSFSFKLNSIKNHLAFGVNLFSGRFLNNLNTNIDKMFIGRFLGSELLGFYTRSLTAIKIPISASDSSFCIIGLGTLSKLQEDEQKFNRYYLNLVGFQILVTLPLLFFIIIKAEPLVFIVLGENWLQTAHIIQAFALFALANVSNSGIRILNTCLGRSHKIRNIGIFNFICTLIVLLCFINKGIIILAFALGAVAFICKILAIYYSTHQTSLRLKDYFWLYLKPLCFSILSMVLASYLEFFFYSDSYFSFYLSAILYFLFYALIWFLFDGKKYINFYKNTFLKNE